MTNSTTGHREGTRGPARFSTTNLRDVALHARVSPATVSRVISENPSVRPETRERVLASMAELNYVVNGLARSMTGRGSRAIAFLVNNMVGPTFAEIATGVEESTSASGNRVTMLTTHGDPDRELELLIQMCEQRAAAVLLVGATPTDASFTDRLHRYSELLASVGAQLVLCGRPEDPALPDVASVYYDNYGGTLSSTRHLIHLGHRRIIFHGAATNHTTAEDRLRGYRDALHEAGIEVAEDLIIPDAFNVREAQERMDNILAAGTKFSAVVGVRDEAAVGAIRALRKRGVSIPDDVSVVGFDDVPFMEDLTPSLTTVRAPYRQIGKLAGELAVAAGSDLHKVLPVELQIRESSAEARIS
ncbi:LacI family DNA-binding transcriptional regulator [Pseudarthrobacter sp. DSP2-3-2b1]|uniref:LacI family DNA-binding transcriptional regulator n=1 Tax=Pseudarthrobacter sp. DSP2-3-2b1 TaxID=2804661 RepID=UPI003CED3DB6